MAVITWPSEVPYRSPVDGATPGQSYIQPLVSQTEGGPPIMRPRPGPRATEYPWRSRLLTTEQWTAFEQFARLDLRQGTLPFSMPIYRPGGLYVERTCQIKDGQWSTDMSYAPKIRVSFTLIIYDW